MKKSNTNSPSILLCTLFLIFITTTISAQSPNTMSYQAVIRDTDNNLIVNHAVGIQISILQGSVNGATLYIENHRTFTNENGLVSIEIGNGYVMYGDFPAINWTNGPYFVKTETDLKGQDKYSIIGISQLLSVPFALHATTAQRLTEEVPETDPVFSAWDKSSGITISESQITNLNHFTNNDETDPVFEASPAAEISNTDIENWNKKIEKESDPEFSAWDKSTGIAISESQITDLNHFTNADESDPIYNNSVARNITQSNINEWDSKSTFSGNYNDLDNKPTTISKFENDVGYQLSSDDDDVSPINELQILYGTTHDIGITNGNKIYLPNFEGDPQFNASPAKNIINSGSGSVITNAERSKLNNIEAGGEVNVQADWNESNTSADAYILNKLTETIALNTAKVGITPAQASAIAANTDKDTTGIYHANRSVLDVVSGVNTGDQDLSELATKIALEDSAAQIRSEIPKAAIAANTGKDTTGIYHANRTALDVVSGINTGDQDLSSFLTSETDPQVGSNTTNYLSKWDGSELVSGSVFDNGNVGIGTETPNSILEVKLPTNNNTSCVNITRNNGTSVFKVNGAGQMYGDGSGLINVKAIANYVQGNSYYDITANLNQYNNIKQVSITVPTAGKIIVNAGACVDWESTKWDVVLYSIIGSHEGDPNTSTSAQNIFYDHLGILTDYNCVDPSDQFTSLSHLRGFTVSSGGTYTFILWANKYTSSAKVELTDATISAMYFPEGGAGSAPMLAPLLETGNDSGILRDEEIISNRLSGSVDGDSPPPNIEESLKVKEESLARKLEAMKKQAEKNSRLSDIVDEQARKIDSMKKEIENIKALLKGNRDAEN